MPSAWARWRCSGAWTSGHSGALIDPGAQQFNFLLCKPRSRRRHDLFVFQTLDHADEFACRALAGNQHWSRVAALERSCPIIQTQTAHLRSSTMAGVATLFKQWCDIASEIDRFGGRSGESPTRWVRTLSCSQHLLHNVAMNVGQAEIASHVIDT